LLLDFLEILLGSCASCIAKSQIPVARQMMSPDKRDSDLNDKLIFMSDRNIIEKKENHCKKKIL